MNNKCICNCSIFNHKYNIYIKCKKKSEFNVRDNNLCLNHMLLSYNKYVLIIQKIYRRYRSNIIINNIYKRLPCDLQNKIKYYINEELYFKNYKKCINKIIINKTNLINYNKNNNKISIEYILYIYKLYHKYFQIIDINYTKFIYNLSDKLLTFYDNNIINIVINMYTDNNLSIIFNNIDFNIDTTTNIHNADDIMNLMYIINKYRNKYIQYNKPIIYV